MFIWVELKTYRDLIYFVSSSNNIYLLTPNLSNFHLIWLRINDTLMIQCKKYYEKSKYMKKYKTFVYFLHSGSSLA